MRVPSVSDLFDSTELPCGCEKQTCKTLNSSGSFPLISGDNGHAHIWPLPLSKQRSWGDENWIVKGTLSPKFGCFWLLGPKKSPSLKVYHSHFHFAKAWHNFIENMCSNLNNQYLVLGELYPLNKLIILPCCCLNYLRSLRLYFYISIYPRHYWNLSIQICIRRHSHHSIVSWHNC